MGRRRWTDEEIEEALSRNEPLVPEHVARATAISRATVQRWLDVGRTSDGLPWRHIRRGRTRLVLAEDVIAFRSASREVREGRDVNEG